jgi:sialate O-acetylesterase
VQDVASPSAIERLVDSLETWILAGQSNMDGRGLLRDPRATLKPVDGVRALNSAGEWEIAADPLHRHWESFTPVHRTSARSRLDDHERHLTDAELARRDRGEGEIRRADLPGARPGGAGLGVAFGQALAEAKGTEVGLIPAAHGGTTVEQWRVGQVPDGGQSLSGSLLKRVQRARETERIELGGILWYQGESDTTLEDSATYAEGFDTWVDAIREHLGAPELPVYVVQLGCFVITELELAADSDLVEAAWDVVRDTQRTAPQRLAHVGVVSAIDLGLVDSVHIDALGLIRLGRRLARLALRQGRSPNVVRVVEQGPDAGNGLHQVRVVCDGVDDGWRPASHITGFEVRDRSGERHRSVDVIDAHPQPDDPRNIDLVLSSDGEFNRDLRVGYGLGFNPPCTAVDAADMPLPAFAPLAVCRA